MSVESTFLLRYEKQPSWMRGWTSLGNLLSGKTPAAATLLSSGQEEVIAERPHVKLLKVWRFPWEEDRITRNLPDLFGEGDRAIYCRTSIPGGWPSWPKLSENTTVRRLVGSWNIERSYVEQVRTHCFSPSLFSSIQSSALGLNFPAAGLRTHHLIDKIQIVTDHFSFAFVKLLLYQNIARGLCWLTKYHPSLNISNIFEKSCTTR